MIKKPLGSFLLLTALGVPGLINTAVAQSAPPQNTQQAVDSQPQTTWLVFLNQLKEVAESSPEIMAEAALLDAEKENYYAEQGDLGLEFSLSHTRYPGGSGSSSSGGGLTALEQYSEARISIDLMHLLARRSSSIDSAKARVEGAQHEMDLKATAATIRFMEDAVTAWTYGFRREALKNALASIDNARSKLKLSEQAEMPEITKATPTKVAEAIILYSEINNNLKAISPLTPKIPRLPNDFSILPTTPPDGDDIYKLASKDLNAQILKAQSLAYKEEAESLRGNGVSLSLYGGFVEQETQTSSGIDTEDGPQYGAQLTVPLGSNQHHLRKKAEFESHAAKLGALAAVRNSQRSLVELRDHWAEAVARMNQAQENMRQQAALLSKLRRRAGSPGSGQAPEPWEVDMQAAVFWTAVANVWEKRAVWVTDALTWGLLSPEYLQANARTGNAQSSRSLCAPYVSCDEIAGN